MSMICDIIVSNYGYITFVIPTIRFETCKEGEELENYTKYRLKAAEELTPLLQSADNLFVIACNKCFKEFDTTQETDLEQFLELAQSLGKTIVGTAKADFL